MATSVIDSRERHVHVEQHGAVLSRHEQEVGVGITYILVGIIYPTF